MGKEYAQERILYGYGASFQRIWEKEYSGVRRASIKEELKGSIQTQAATGLFALYVFFFIVLLIRAVQTGKISVQLGIVLVSLIPFGLKRILGDAARAMGEITKAYRAMEVYRRVQEFEEERRAEDEAPDKGFHQMAFIDVSFAYPGTDRQIYGSDLQIADKGYDGITAVLQNYKLYALTLRENCVFEDREIDDDEIRKKLCDVLEKRWYDALPEGLDTLVDRAFGGTEFSGGERQKIAIVRALIRKSAICFFDEPTAAVDPYTEDALYKKMLEIAGERTAIFITHRLATVQYADRVVVMKEGQIAECGTHSELMASQGEYARMYIQQKESYL